jgi:hypothetical protein
LPLAHRLEQSRLHLRRRAIDFIGEQQVVEDRPALELEGALLRTVDFGAGEIGGQQVRRELDALPRAVDRRGERLGQTRLADARHVLDQQMTLGQEADHGEVDRLLLAVHDRGDVRRDRIEQGRERRGRRRLERRHPDQGRRRPGKSAVGR